MIYNRQETAQRIKALRTSKNLTQKELSSKLNISVRFVQKIEAGSSTPSIDLFVELSELFEVSLDYLILGQGGPRDEMKQGIQTIITILSDLERLV